MKEAMAVGRLPHLESRHRDDCSRSDAIRLTSAGRATSGSASGIITSDYNCDLLHDSRQQYIPGFENQRGWNISQKYRPYSSDGALVFKVTLSALFQSDQLATQADGLQQDWEPEDSFPISLSHIDSRTLHRYGWQQRLIEELEEVEEYAMEERFDPPEKDAVKFSRQLIHSLAALGLPPATVFPEEERSVSIQIGRAGHGGTILLTCFADSSVECMAIGRGIQFECKFSDVSSLPNEILKGLVSELYG